jgi:hypothetical protein
MIKVVSFKNSSRTWAHRSAAGKRTFNPVGVCQPLRPFAAKFATLTWTQRIVRVVTLSKCYLLSSTGSFGGSRG